MGVTSVIRSTVRATDTPARYGGDEFLVLPARDGCRGCLRGGREASPRHRRLQHPDQRPHGADLRVGGPRGIPGGRHDRRCAHGVRGCGAVRGQADGTRPDRGLHHAHGAGDHPHGHRTPGHGGADGDTDAGIPVGAALGTGSFGGPDARSRADSRPPLASRARARASPRPRVRTRVRVAAPCHALVAAIDASCAAAIDVSCAAAIDVSCAAAAADPLRGDGRVSGSGTVGDRHQPGLGDARTRARRHARRSRPRGGVGRPDGRATARDSEVTAGT